MAPVIEFLKEWTFLNTMWIRYLLGFLILLLGLVGRKIFDVYISHVLLRITSKTAFRYDQEILKALNPPVSALFLVLSFFLAINVLELPNEPFDLRLHLFDAFRIAIAIILIWTAFRLTDTLAMYLSDRLSHQDKIIRLQFIPLLKRALRIFTLIIGGLLIVQNLGYNVGSLLAGLGIGGLAVALAAQESLSNFFGSVVVLTDRPFKVGDWITVGETDGDVEEIGFRSTRVRTFDKTLVTIPNKVLANSAVLNWSAMPKRRVKQTISLTYDTPPQKIEAFTQGVRQILKDHEGVDQSFYLVHFTDFNASSLDVFVHYFTVSTKWPEYLQIREQNNLDFMKLAEKLGISFAFPSRTLYWGAHQNPQLDAQGLLSQKEK